LQATNDRKLIKDCKDAGFRLVFLFKKKRKAPSSGWDWRPDQMGQNDLNLPPLWRNPQKTQSQNLSTFLKL